MNNDENLLSNKIQTIAASLIKKHELTMEGEEILPDIDWVNTKIDHEIAFEDEFMAHLLAGNVPCFIYDEWEKAINDAGYEITDTDGTILHLKPLEK